MTSRKIVLLAALCMGAAMPLEAQLTAEQIAQAIVIGQAYTSGNVYVGGFLGDVEQREWPQRITTVALRVPDTQPVSADFIRTLPPDSEEQFYFTRKEDGGSAGPDDLFSTIDSMVVTDPHLALYRAAGKRARPIAIFGWNEQLPVVDIRFRDVGRPRPVTEAERLEIAADRKTALPASECTTEPRFLDSAETMFTATIAKTSFRLRLSTYQNPGCAGHLAEIYVLDVLEPGRDPRRFRFSHYVGVL